MNREPQLFVGNGPPTNATDVQCLGSRYNICTWIALAKIQYLNGTDWGPDWFEAAPAILEQALAIAVEDKDERTKRAMLAAIERLKQRLPCDAPTSRGFSWSRLLKVSKTEALWKKIRVGGSVLAKRIMKIIALTYLDRVLRWLLHFLIVMISALPFSGEKAAIKKKHGSDVSSAVSLCYIDHQALANRWRKK